MRVIKKYKNRRLYDTEKSCYITFEQIRQMVLDEIDFKVIDTSNDKDITSATLLQVLVEQDAKYNNVLSNDVLRYVIKISAHPMHQTFNQAFEQMVLTMNKQIAANPMVETYQQALNDWQESMQNMVKQWQDNFKK